MKKLILILSFFASLQAFAQPIPVFELKEGDLSMYPMTGHYEVVYAVPDCPDGALCLPTTHVMIQYILGGCMDRAVALEKIAYNDNGNIDIYVTALNISTKASQTVKCIAPPTYQQNIFLGGGMISEESIKVHFLGIPEDGME